MKISKSLQVSQIAGYWIPIGFTETVPTGLFGPLSRTFSTPTIIHSSYDQDDIKVFQTPFAQNSDCFPIWFPSNIKTRFYNCGGKLFQSLDLIKTNYGWRIPYFSNGHGSSVKVFT